MKNNWPTDWDIFNTDERKAKIWLSVVIVAAVAIDHFYPGYKIELATFVILLAIEIAVENLKLYIHCRFKDDNAG
jgi:hypothetical protein